MAGNDKKIQAPEGVKMTPMMEQFWFWKNRYPGCILFFRMGDFFECFYDDAKLVSRELDLTLTARDPSKSMPMAGVPHHAVDQYASRLIEKGYKIAVCEQMTPPDGRTLVEREVVKVLTPGTYIPEEGALTASLASLLISGEEWTVGFLTPSASTVQVGTFPADEAKSILLSFAPREILIPRGRKVYKKLCFPGGISLTELPAEEFDPLTGLSRLSHQWKLSSLEGFGLQNGDPRIGAVNALVTYSEETSFSDASHIRSISRIMPEGYMHLDWNTQVNLDLWGDSGSLFDCLNKCVTPFGKRLLHQVLARPLCDADKIDRRLDIVQTFYDRPEVSRELSSLLEKCGDIERSVAKLHMRSGNPRDLGTIRDTLDVHPAVYRLVNELCPQIGLPAPEELAPLRDILSRALLDTLPRSLAAGRIVRCGWNGELDRWKSLGDSSDDWLEQFTARERDRTGVTKLKVGSNKVFGFYIEISKAALADAAVPDEYIRKQTLVNAERFITPELKDYEERRLLADAKIDEIEALVFEELKTETLKYTQQLQSLGEALAEADLFNSFATAACDSGWTRPVVRDTRKLHILQGRHPMVEQALQGRPCIPNDLEMHSGRRTALVTGPNMAGKSTYLRMAAVLQIMAQTGSFVPAAEAHLPLTDRLFTRIGAHDELSRGNSTFMVEMIETANILHNVTPRSLVILDEIGRGTSTYDGMSIAWASVEYLHTLCGMEPFVLFATHYHELTGLEERMPGLFNVSMGVEELSDGVRFLYKICEGAADRSYGIEVARIAGLPRVVLNRAQEILEHLEADGGIKAASTAFVPSTQVKMFDLSADAFIDEVATLDPDSLAPRDALKKLYHIVSEAKKLRCE